MSDNSETNAVRVALQFSRSEVVRAKTLIRGLLSDGSAHGIRAIQVVLIESAGNSIPSPRNEQPIEIQRGGNGVPPDHPAIVWRRQVLAASEALLDLIAQGIVVGVSKSPVHEDGQPVTGGNPEMRIPYTVGNLSTSASHSMWLPNFANAYRLAPYVAQDSGEFFLDIDIFTADLDALRLDSRTLRALKEALRAYRSGLFVAAASLLGTAFEGAWYAAGERLRHLDADDRLAVPLENDETKKVQKLVGEILRQSSEWRGGVDGLLTQAELLRQLRNYGVHPRSGETDHLEAFFTEAGVASLLGQTYLSLKQLAAGVEGRSLEG